MLKYSFYNDYSEGVHSSILDLLVKTNLTQEPGYGEDAFSFEAKKMIQSYLGKANTDIHFVSGGTQANLIALASMLKPYESVISAETGHISVHEAGAIEATGHKINTVPSVEGKLTIEGIDSVVKAHTDEHMVKPKVVFISNSTELGTVYSLADLKNISDYCRKNGLYLYLDGARLGSALMSSDSDLNLEQISSLVDMFYIGGTKNGALLGEALVIVNQGLQENFRFHLKQRGALLAKGRIIALQFLALFTNNLYFDLAKNANQQAEKLTQGIDKCGHMFLTQSTTNQIFPIFPNHVLDALKDLYGFYVWKKIDEKSSAIRLVTSWATQDDEVEMFLDDLRKLAKF
jgi:threonine aldolase